MKNYSIKISTRFYCVFIMFLFTSLSFQEVFAQEPIDGKIKLYFEKVEKTKAQMDELLANDSLIYLQVYAEFSPEFTEDRLGDMRFGASTFSWVLCDEAGTFASSASEDVILLGQSRDKCWQGSQDSPDKGAASYGFAQHGCPTYGHYATVESGGDFYLHQSGLPANTVKMGAIGFKLLSSDGFFVRMENSGKIDQSFGAVLFSIREGETSVTWPNNSGVYDWGKTDRLGLATVGGVVVKKGFKNKSV